MLLKIHSLFFHLDFFTDNLGDVSDAHGEHFVQQIKAVERWYHGFWNAAMIAGHIWTTDAIKIKEKAINFCNNS